MALNTRIKTRRDTAANWEVQNPVLLEGELIIVTTNAGDTRFKVGDGVKTYKQLPFQDESLYNALSGKADTTTVTELWSELDAKVDSGHIHSWTDLTDKPFEDTRETKEMNIEWDGVIGYSPYVVHMQFTTGSSGFYRVSNEVPTVEDLIGGTIFVKASNGNVSALELTSSDVEDVGGGNILCASGYAIVINTTPVNYKNGVFTEPGLYFSVTIVNDTVSSHTISVSYQKKTGGLNKIDQLYLDAPDFDATEDESGHILNRTHWDSRKTVENRISWNCDTEGRTYVPQGYLDYIFYKVSDDVLTNAELKTFVARIYNNGWPSSTVKYGASATNMAIAGDAYVFQNTFAVVYEPGVVTLKPKATGSEAYDVTFPESGVYFAHKDGGSYAKWLSYQKQVGELKQLDTKFIPDEYVTETELGNALSTKADVSKLDSKQDILIGTEGQVPMFKADGELGAVDVASGMEAIETLAELGIVIPAADETVIYTDEHNNVLII